jgi:hypothetical protein
MASEIKANKISPATGTALTIGDSGDTVSITGTVSTTGNSTNTGNLDVTGDLIVDTDTLYVDSTNNRVGIGTSSPSNALEVTTDTTDQIRISDVTGDGWEFRAGTNLIFKDDGTERMRINSSGYVRINNTDSGNYLLKIKYDGASQEGLALQSSYSGFGNMIRFINSAGGSVGDISSNNSTTTYATSSDYRLKENIVALDNGIDRLKQIPVHRFNFIVNPDTTVDGFLAHEVQDVVPEAITGTKDAVDAEGNPEYQGIDQSKLVPLLTSALQEAVARIESLEARVAVLEAN